MTAKEERIEVSTYDLNNKEWNGDIPIDIHKVYTRQEAIEKIKNASAFYLSHKLGCTKEEEAEYILNALLEGGK